MQYYGYHLYIQKISVTKWKLIKDGWSSVPHAVSLTRGSSSPEEPEDQVQQGAKETNRGQSSKSKEEEGKIWVKIG